MYSLKGDDFKVTFLSTEGYYLVVHLESNAMGMDEKRYVAFEKVVSTKKFQAWQDGKCEVVEETFFKDIKTGEYFMVRHADVDFVGQPEGIFWKRVDGKGGRYNAISKYFKKFEGINFGSFGGAYQVVHIEEPEKFLVGRVKRYI